MVSKGREEWCVLWCTIVTLLGADLRLSIKTVNALLKIAEKAFKVSLKFLTNSPFYVLLIIIKIVFNKFHTTMGVSSYFYKFTRKC